MTNPERRARGLAGAVLLASAVPWFGSALVGRSLLCFRDLIQNLYPWRRFWVEEIRAGRWPLWDPYAASGSPYLANPNNLSLFPLSWLQAVLPFDLAFNWTIVLTWLLAQAGAYRLGRRLGMGRPAALLAALAFGGSGYGISALNLANVLVAAAAAPWVAWAALGLARRAAARDAAFFGGAIALCLVGGEPLALGVALSAAALLLWLWRRREGAPASRRWRAALAGMGMGLLLAAPIALPAAEMVRRSERGEGLEEAARTRWSLSALGAGGFLIPRLEGDPTSFDPRRYWGQGRQHGTMPLLLSLYAGVPLLALAAIGWAGLRGRARIATAAALALSLGLAAGKDLPIFTLFEALGPPGQWVRYPAKFLLGFFGPVCLLGGLGLDRLRRGETPGRAVRALPLAVAAALALALGAGRWWIEEGAAAAFGLPAEAARAAAAGVRRSLLVALALSIAAGLLLGPLRRRLRPLAASTAWTLLVLGDLWAAQASLVPRAPAGLVRAPGIFAGHVRAGDRVFREERPEGFRLRAPDASRIWGFLWDRATLARGAASEARIYSVLERPTDLLWPATTARVRRWAIEAEPERRVQMLRRLGVQWWLSYDAADLAGSEEVEVARAICDPPLRLRRLLAPLPRLFWTDRFAVAADEEALRRGLTGPSAGPDVWVEAAGGAMAPAQRAWPARAGDGGESAGICRLVAATTDEMELRCEAERPGLAVVLDAWYPGWEVRMDGAPLEVLRVNGAYRAVELPPGRHAVVWRFRPLSVQAGRALGLLGLAMLAAAASRRPPERRKHPPPSGTSH